MDRNRNKPVQDC